MVFTNFAYIFMDTSRIFRDFAQIFNKSKLLVVNKSKLAPLPPTPLITAVCCNSQVLVNMLTSSRFSSIQGKTISRILEFGVSLQYFRMSF